MATLRKNVSQVGYPGSRDVDECWMVATLTCLKNICRPLVLPGTKLFREAAGVPDVQGRADGGTGFDITNALRELYPGLPWRGTLFPWSYFKSLMKPGFVASIAVDSGELPLRLQYGFKGGHRVAVELLPDGTWILFNPLAKNGTPPEKIGEAALRRATSAFSGQSQVGAIVFDPAEVKEYFKLNVYVRINRTGKFTLPAGKAMRVYYWGNGGWRVKTKVAAATYPRTGVFDSVLDRTAGLADPSNLVHITSGPGAGYFARFNEIQISYDPAPTTFSKAYVDAAVAKAKEEFKSAVVSSIKSL